MKILLTGASGFLGWHTRVRLSALTNHEIIPVTRANWIDLPKLMQNVDAVIHVAGVNRAEPDEVRAGNVRLARDVAEAVKHSGTVSKIVFANSIQAGNGTPYGDGKAMAAATLSSAASAVGARFGDVHLPNLFGEHGVPEYNSFVATFIESVISRSDPRIDDREVGLLHAQGAAQSLIDGLNHGGVRQPLARRTTVVEVYELLREFHSVYVTGDMPALEDPFRVDLFNSYRSALFPSRYPLSLEAREDERGRLVEIVRSHGGQGQTFVSTTKPGVTRGDHFHLHKVERFAVLSGSARISLRRKFSNDVISFDVTGDHPTVVDMPTLWVHNITNVGGSELTTLFWTHTLFDPEAPDTYWERVCNHETAIT